MENLLEQQRQKLIIKLAKMMHEEWRETRRKDDNSFETHFKKTADTEWIKSHTWAEEVDIANTDFNELPKDWQEENLLSAKVAIEKIEDALYIIHDKWLDRNDQWAAPEDKTQYSKLPKGEKVKDMAILEKAIEIMKGELR